MKKLKCCESNKGFTLVEVLLAIVILGLIAVPILQMFSVLIRLTRNQREC